MVDFVINVTNGADTGTVVADVGFKYNILLNQINEAEIKISGTSENKRGLLTIGATVKIYKNGTEVFKGLIDNTDYFLGGTVAFHASGWEVWLAKENGTYANSPWTSTASATIQADIIGDSSYFTAGTINTGYTLDYRLTTGQSIWNGISNLANKTSQDVEISYSADTIGVLDHLGSSTTVATLNDGKEITNVRKSVGYPRGNNIIVWGKGDGDNQIKGTAPDATSIAAYGTITKNIIDKSCISTTEADRLAAAELALNKDPPEIYDFDMTNPEYSGLSIGDVVTLNALDQDITNKEVRIVGIEEGERNGENYMTLQVTNKELKTLMKTRNQVVAKIIKDQSDANSYMQGGPNFNSWGAGINAKTSYPLKLLFEVSAEMMQDQAGNLRVNSMTLDYDIDPYKKSVGTASFDGGDPQVEKESAEIAVDLDDTTESAEGGDAGKVTDSANTSQTVTFTSTSTEYTIDTIDGGSTDTQKIGVWVSGAIVADSSVTSFNFRLLRHGSAIDFNDPVISHVLSNGSDRSIVYAYLEAPENTDGRDYDVMVEIYTGSITSEEWLFHLSYQTTKIHKHSVGSYATKDHLHADGSYEIDSTDIDDISIGDDVSEAGSLNSSSVNLYLDFWSGSAWVNKHTISNTTKTLDTDVDITNSGTYPDATGSWRVRVEPITASPDYAQAIVKIKHNLDS